jgi:hypothetical protein
MKIDFWTSTEYSGFLAELMAEMNDAGLETRQRFLISEASYRGARSTPARLWLRLQQYVIYPLYLCASLLFGKKADVVVVCTNTFYAPWLATFFHKRVVHLVYDLFPEALLMVGTTKCTKSTEDRHRKGVVVRLCRWVVGSTLKRAEMNVFLGERLQAYVESVYGKVENGVVIPVGASAFGAEVGRRTSEVDGEEVSGLRPPISDLLSPVTILYCGNLGRMHDIKTLEAFWGGWSAPARRTPQRPGDTPVPAEIEQREIGLGSGSARAGVPALLFKFHCNGPKKQELIDTVSALGLDTPPTSDLRSPTSDLRPPISIQGSLGSGEWRDVMLSSQVALVTMVPGAENVVMPSKTYSAMMAGQAILAIAPEASDLVDTIKAADCGWWVASEGRGASLECGPDGGGSALGVQELAAKGPENLRIVLEEIVSDPGELARKRANARAYAEAHFSMKVLAQEWVRALRGMAAE